MGFRRKQGENTINNNINYHTSENLTESASQEGGETQSGAQKGARNANTVRTAETELTTDPGRPDRGNDTTGELQG